VDDPLDPAVIEMVDEMMPAYEYAPASELKLNIPTEVLQAFRGQKVGKVLGLNCMPNRVLRHLPKCAITFLTEVFYAVLHRQCFSPAWKHARMVSILKPGKDPMLLSSYRPISLLDTVGKLFEKIPLLWTPGK
jgi:hypothetical protein